MPKFDLSLVIPTYNERENISILLEKIFSEFKKNKIKGEVIVVDDNSPDKTGDLVESLIKDYENLKIVHRKGKLGLSSAVLEGWKISKGKILGVMDADLSHPTEKIKELFFPIQKEGIDFTIGSRYVKGGKILGWGFRRKILSYFATVLARPLTSVKDPMTGFFMIKRKCVDFNKLNPKGFKILLEVILKAKYNQVKEIPIVFTNRIKGKSKAGIKEIFCYLENLWGYKKYVKLKFLNQFFKFALVGLLGTFVNIAFLYLFTDVFGIYYVLSAIFSFVISVLGNFVLNKIWTFEENFKYKTIKKCIQFLIISVIVLGVNLFFLYVFTEFFKIYYLVSQVLAIGIGLVLNFLGNKFWTFN